MPSGRPVRRAPAPSPPAAAGTGSPPMPDPSRRRARQPAGPRRGGATTTGRAATVTDDAAAAGTPDEVQAGVRRSPGPQVRPKNGMDRYFEVTARRSTVGRELRGGLTTFFTMAYIVVLNP